MVGNKDSLNCPLMHSLSILSGKWKASIIWYLGTSGKDVCRYGELKDLFPYKVSHKVFTAQLRELEADGVLSREEFDEMPPRVEYGLTEKGRSLLQILSALRDWGVLYGDYDERMVLSSKGGREGDDFVYDETGGTGDAPFTVRVSYRDERMRSKIERCDTYGRFKVIPAKPAPPYTQSI